MTLVLPSALLLLLVAIEAFVLRVVQRKDVPWNQVVFNLNSGHTVLWLFRGLEIAVFHAVYTRFGLGLVNDWHPIAQFGVAMLFWDFCFYWLHRLHHAWGHSLGGACRPSRGRAFQPLFGNPKQLVQQHHIDSIFPRSRFDWRTY